MPPINHYTRKTYHYTTDIPGTLCPRGTDAPPFQESGAQNVCIPGILREWKCIPGISVFPIHCVVCFLGTCAIKKTRHGDTGTREAGGRTGHVNDRGVF